MSKKLWLSSCMGGVTPFWRGRRIRLPLLIFVVLLLLSTPLWAQDQPEPIEISGATYAEYDDRTGIWILRGDEVVIQRGDLRMSAPFLRYNRKERTVYANGGVILRSPELEVRAPWIEAFLDEERAVAGEGGTIQYFREDGEATLRAERIEAWWGEGRALAEGNVVATSTQDEQVTTFNAQRAQVWDRGRRVVAEGSVTLHRGDTLLTCERLELDEGRDRAVATGSPWVKVRDVEGRAGLIEVNTRDEVAVLRGGVRVTKGTMEATAPEGEIHRKAGWARLTGGVVLTRTRDQQEAVGGTKDLLTAETMTVYLDEDRIVAEGSPRAVVYIGSLGR